MNGFWQRIKNHFVPSHHNAYRPHLLRRRSLLFLLALALLAEGALVANLIARQSSHDFLAAIIQSEIISLTNAERAQNKVAALKESPLLDRSAQAKADDMAERGYFAHKDPQGREPWVWIQEAGYDYQYAGENLAVRFVDSQDVVAGWMASPTHRANIIKPSYTDIGVGIAQGVYKGQPATFVVQYFAAPAVAVAAAATTSVAASSGTTTVAASVPAVQILGVETIAAPPPPSASFNDSLARQLGRVLSEPRAATNWMLGGIALLLMLAIAFAFFHHIQIQAHDLLLPGTLVAVVALTLMLINTRALPGVIPDSQAASVANAILVP